MSTPQVKLINLLKLFVEECGWSNDVEFYGNEERFIGIKKSRHIVVIDTKACLQQAVWLGYERRDQLSYKPHLLVLKADPDLLVKIENFLTMCAS